MNTKKNKAATVIVMCGNIYGEDGVKHLKGARFDCEKEWAEAIRKGDEDAKREYRLEII